VHPPDLNRSDLDFVAEDGAIRFGLSAIKGVGEGVIRAVLDARRREGAFRSPFDLCVSVDSRQLNRKVLEALVGSGSLDGFGQPRERLEAGIDTALEYGQKQRQLKESGQGSLFGGDEDAEEVVNLDERLPRVEPWDEKTRLRREKETLGFYVSGHPLESHRALLTDFASHTIGELKRQASGLEVAVGGLLAEVRKRKSRKGDWWAIVQLEDLEGQMEVLVFPKTFAKIEERLIKDRAVLIGGRFESEDGRVRLIADDVTPIEELKETNAEAVRIRFDSAMLDPDTVERLATTLAKHRGRTPLFLEVLRPGRFRLTARAESKLCVKPSKALTAAVEALLGPGRLRYQTTRPAESRRPVHAG